MLVNFDISKMSWTKLRHMVKKKKQRLKRIESSKKFREMLLQVKQHSMIGSVASKTVISMLTTVRVKEGQKPSKTLNWRHCLMRIRAKRKKSLLSALGVTRQAISKRLHALGKIQKQGTWVPYDLKPRDVDRRFSTVNNCFSGKKRKVFFTASRRVMKNGFITATQREESHGDCPVMLLRRRLGRIFTLRRLCCVFGGTRSVLFIINS